ncbi:MAG: hypothetical protein Q9179_007598, partial [Wetmoreana sp. 5 TL-2023]
ADNFLLGFEESSVIEDYVRRLKESSPLCKEVDGHPIYQSAADFGDLRKGVGLLKISDFGAAVYGNVSTPHCHDIQPQQFCAPEILLKAKWTYSADIWNLGMVVSGGYVQRRRTLIPLTSPGEFKYPKLVPSEAITFSNLTTVLQGEDKRLFIEFASKMLRWLPEERLSAKELYTDPWLNFKPKIDQRRDG